MTISSQIRLVTIVLFYHSNPVKESTKSGSIRDINAKSLKIIQANPGTFAGTSIFSSISSGIGSGILFTAGFGIGASYGIDPASGSNVDAGLGLKEGISIPLKFSPA